MTHGACSSLGLGEARTTELSVSAGGGTVDVESDALRALRCSAVMTEVRKFTCASPSCRETTGCALASSEVTGRDAATSVREDVWIILLDDALTTKGIIPATQCAMTL